MPKPFEKDPHARKRFSVDWTSELGADSIASSDWEVPTGVTMVAKSHTAKIATILLAGGTVGETYAITNRIRTNADPYEEDDRTIRVKIKEM